jgi:DNA-binding MarR family transcriptional regulator
MDRRLLLMVATSSGYVGQIVDGCLSEIGLPGYLLALLTHVRDHGPVAPSTISSVSGVPPTTLRDNIQRLVDRKLVRRIPNPGDGRSYLLSVTARGEAVTRAADPELLTAYLALESRLSQPLAVYESMLDELNEALEQVAATVAPAGARTRVASRVRPAARGSSKRRSGPRTPA